MLDLQTHAVDAKALATVSSAYQYAMAEVARGSGYLPSRSHRRTIAAKMIAAADAGEGDANRLKEAGLEAIRNRDVAPLSLAFAARMRRTYFAS
jgi:hypothetical protein